MYPCVFVLLVGLVHSASTSMVHSPLLRRVQCEFNGTFYNQGESFQQGPCTRCSCGPFGLQACATTMCEWARCFNAVNDPTKCCPVCPDGPNCRVRGVTIPDGQERKIDGMMICGCHGGMATCRFIRSPGCRYRGRLYPVGSFKPTPCEHCQCEGNPERVYCAIEDCRLPICVDSVRKANTCCPVCPNGPNCRVGNKTISDGQEHKINNLTTCRCNGGVTECRTPPGCMYDGKHYPLGPFSPSPCSHCDCTAPGEVHCAFEDCFFRCVDSIRKPNTCCPICPNGPNCFLGPKTISADREYHDGDRVCRCPDHPSMGLLAICDRPDHPPRIALP